MIANTSSAYQTLRRIHTCVFVSAILLLPLFGARAVSAQPSTNDINAPLKPYHLSAEQVEVGALQKVLKKKDKLTEYYATMLGSDICAHVLGQNLSVPPVELQNLRQVVANALNGRIDSEQGLARLQAQYYASSKRTHLSHSQKSEIDSLQSNLTSSSAMDDASRKRLNFLLTESAPGGVVDHIDENEGSSTTQSSNLGPKRQPRDDPIRAIAKTVDKLSADLGNLHETVWRLQSQISTIWRVGMSLIGIGLVVACLGIVKWRRSTPNELTARSGNASGSGPQNATPVANLVDQKEPLDFIDVSMGWPDPVKPTEHVPTNAGSPDFAIQLRTLLGPNGECSDLIPSPALSPDFHVWETAVMAPLLNPGGTYFTRLYDITEERLKDRLSGVSPSPLRDVITHNVQMDIFAAKEFGSSFHEKAVVDLLRNGGQNPNNSTLYKTVTQIAQKAANSAVLAEGLTIEAVRREMLELISPDGNSTQWNDIQAAIIALAELQLAPIRNEQVAETQRVRNLIDDRQEVTALVQWEQAQTTLALQYRQTAMLNEIEARSKCMSDVARFKGLAHHLRCSLPEAAAFAFPADTLSSERIESVMRKSKEVETDLTDALSRLIDKLDDPREVINLDSLRKRIERSGESNPNTAEATGAAGDMSKEPLAENEDLASRSSEQILAVYADLLIGIRQQTESFKLNREIFSKFTVELCKIASRLRDPLTDVYNCSSGKSDSDDSRAWSSLLTKYCGFLRECNIEVFIPMPNVDYNQYEHSADPTSYSSTSSENRVIARTIAPGMRVDGVFEPAKVVVRGR